jgi:spermidine/putrescine transport system permease protein
MTATTGVAPAPAARPRRSFRSGLLTSLLVLPASAWYLILLVAPLVIVVIMSFGTKSRFGGYDPAFVLDNYQDALDPNRVGPFVTSIALAIGGTGLCLLAALPIAYFIATRGGGRKSLFIILLIVPFWTSFLIRTYAWLTILGPDGVAGFIGGVVGNDSFRILGTPAAVLLGVVYGYLPLMIFPIYVTMERMDRTLIEASKDLGAGRWATFRQVTLPITSTGLITGSILVFIPLMGEYVIPAILGYGRVFLIGNQLVLQFLESRNWPQGAARAVVLIVIMLVSVVVYLWFVNRGRKTREVSVL